MSNVGRLCVLVALFVLGGACSWGLLSPAPAQEKENPARAAAKYEYKVQVGSSKNDKPAEEWLNQWGAEGYRLVSTTATSASQLGGGLVPVTSFVMERAKP
jgi:hypothetical protein